MEQKGVIAIFRGRNPVFKTVVNVILRGESVGPRFVRERWIGDSEIEGSEPITICEIGGGECVPVP